MSTHTPWDAQRAEIIRLRTALKSYERDPLIAAAPDLLAALKECRRVLGIRDDFAPLGHAATLAHTIDTAIAKAEGT